MYNWKQVREDLLKILPPEMKYQKLSLPWFAKQFVELSSDADVMSI